MTKEEAGKIILPFVKGSKVSADDVCRICKDREMGVRLLRILKNLPNFKVIAGLDSELNAFTYSDAINIYLGEPKETLTLRKGKK